METENKQEVQQKAVHSLPFALSRKNMLLLAVSILLLAGLIAFGIFFAVKTHRLSGELSSTQSTLSENQQQLEDTQHQLQDAQSQLQDTQSQLSEAQNQVQNQQSELTQKQATIDQYKSAVSSLTEQLAAKKKVQKEAITPIIYAPEDAPVCYLTFDDGPSENTLKILDILKESGITATFFVKGTSTIQYVQNIVDAGSAVALHTNTHDYASIYSSEEAFFSDLEQVGAKVQAILGYTPKVIRFPGGSSNAVSKKYNRGIMSRLVKLVEEQGYSYFDWNCDSGDASGNNVSVSKIMSNIRSQTGSKEKVVVLMHDTDAKDTTVDALPQIIEFYRNKGYRFDKLSVDIAPVHHGVNN